jgi:tRNA dimethylallyltransferase
VPLLTGGSGLYLRAAQEGLASTPPHDPAARERLRFELAAEGAAALHERLRRSDPESAARLAVSDVQRVLRALEVLEASGKPLSWWHRQPARAGVEGEWRIVELTVEPAELSKRIAERTRWMFEHGLIEEADAIASGGGEAALRKLRAVGYDEALDVREGRLTLAAAEARTIVRTRQLAKRQRTWFRHQIEAERVDATRLDPDSLVAIVRAALGL